MPDEERALEPNRAVKGKDVSLVSRREGSRTWNSVLYIREHLVHVQKKLDAFIKSERKDQLYVTGPPGCGKTCFLYLWARRLSVLGNKMRVLIVQFREKQTNFIWIREPGGALWRMEQAIEPEELRQTVKIVLNESKDKPFDLCIHDGVLDLLQICSSMLGTLNTAVTNGVIRKVVHVTSLAFSLSGGGQLLYDAGTISFLSVDSWREENYEEAVSCQAFLSALRDSGRNPFDRDKSILADETVDDDASDEAEMKPEASKTNEQEAMDTSDENCDNDVTGDTPSSVLEVVKNKYFFAGGSARFMFQYTIKELKADLKKRLSAVASSEWSSFAQESVSSGTASAVNTLMQQFEGRCTPVSKYVLFCAYEKCKGELVRSVRAAANATNNPSLKGWAFELEQVDLIRSSLESGDMNPQSVTNGKGFIFHPRLQAEFDEENFTGDFQFEGADVPPTRPWGRFGVWARGRWRWTLRTFRRSPVMDDEVVSEEEKVTEPSPQQDGLIIWCLKWNQGCFDVAFYENEILVTLQFTVSEKHSLKLGYVRKLRAALERKGVPLSKFVHIGVRMKDWTEFRFEDAVGEGRQVGEEEPEFEIDICRSPPLRKTSSHGFKCDTDSGMLIYKQSLYELGRKRRRSEGS